MLNYFKLHRSRVVLIALLILGLPTLAACTVDEDQGEVNRTTAVQSREETYARAVQAVPAPVPQAFPLRAALVEFVERQSLENHPWYIYALGQNGQPLGYFVSASYPISTCNFLSSSESVVTEHEGTQVLTAPSLDGMFYGGGGSSSACTGYFLFDATTGAAVVFDLPGFFASDVPLALDVPLLSPAAGAPVQALPGDGAVDPNAPVPDPSQP